MGKGVAMKTGLVSVSFRSCSAKEILQACAACGITSIEWGSDVHAPANDILGLRQLAKAQSEAGICCCSYGTYFRVGQNSAEELLPYIEAAKILGTEVLRIWCGTNASAKYTDKEKKALLDDCRTLAGIAEEKGVLLCTEFHRGTFTDTAESVEELCRFVSSPYLRTYWQPNQFCSVEENLAAAKQVAPLTRHIHVFNWEGEAKYPLAEAKQTWKNYLSCFSGEPTALLEFMPDGKIETLRGEHETLNSIIKELEK